MSITITRSPVIAELDADNQHVWRLSATALSDTEGLPSEIFVYHVMPVGYDLDEVFECVASVPQLSEIGLSPLLTGETVVPYYRKSSFTLDFRSPKEAESVWEDIKEDIKDLLDNFNASAELSLSETEVIS